MVSTDKKANLVSAREKIDEAAKSGARIVTLPECFQSPYATDQFEEYSEEIPKDLSRCNQDDHPSMYMLREAAMENEIYLIGGSVRANNLYILVLSLSPSLSLYCVLKPFKQQQ
jgi:omega-amidase